MVYRGILSRISLFVLVAGLLSLSATDGARAGGFSIIHAFQGTDGANPAGGLIADTSGNLYGTTTSGGPTGGGTVFKIAPDGTYTILYSFCTNQDESCPDGLAPEGALAMDASGNLYGTTNQGGGFQCGFGCGVVFEVTPDGAERAIYAFQGGSVDGYAPESGVIIDSAGNLYGTTYYGGETDVGTVFEITNTGTERVLWEFGGSPDGVYPVGGLVMDKFGNLYGTTSGETLDSREQCGAGFCGTIFRISSVGRYLQLYSFCARTKCQDGGNPDGTLIVDGKSLFGTTFRGGAPGCEKVGCGTVFAFSLETNSEKILHNFSGGTGGAAPYSGLIADGAGHLVGTTHGGGSGKCGVAGCGTAFTLGHDKGGAFNVIHSFNGAKGEFPTSPLLLHDGNYYGTVQYGGNCVYVENGCGFVFKITK